MVKRSEAALVAGKVEDAERLARLAIERDATYVPARLALGRVLEARGRAAEAAAVYAEAARISPFSPGVSGSLRRVWLGPLTSFGLVARVLWIILRIVGRHFDQRSVLVGLLVGTAVLIVGTLVLLSRQRWRFASLSLEDRRLLELHGSRSLLLGPAPHRLFAAAGRSCCCRWLQQCSP